MLTANRWFSDERSGLCGSGLCGSGLCGSVVVPLYSALGTEMQLSSVSAIIIGLRSCPLHYKK